jgi:deoxyribonuclease-1-like protein
MDNRLPKPKFSKGRRNAKTRWLCAPLLFLLLFPLFAGCDMLATPQAGDNEGGATTNVGAGDDNDELVRIGTFNIQVFGQSKLKKSDVMEVLAEVALRFDVLAIQEVRSIDQNVLPRLVELINSKDANYDFVIGPRQGRTTSKEQYAFVYNRARLAVDDRFVYSVDDPDDLLHRPPLVARFQTVRPSASQAFTFTLINIHTDPDEVSGEFNELNVLDDVVKAVRNDGSGEDDIILLGDLNADPDHFAHLAGLPEIMWVVEGEPTNVARSKTYDNILFHRRHTAEFTGAGGVFDFAKAFDLTDDQAKLVSDHFPVWAEFSIYEGVAPALASGRNRTQR